jgi:hypothetical protein
MPFPGAPHCAAEVYCRAAQKRKPVPIACNARKGVETGEALPSDRSAEAGLRMALEPTMPHREGLDTEHLGWLSAAVMGANDGILSTASLVLGVAASVASAGEIVVVGIAGLVAGAMSMAAGEYVSVSSQADIERADLERERRELADDPDSELNELTGIWARRGLDAALARQVAVQLTAHDANAAHARDELGRSELLGARPVQAVPASAATVAAGGQFGAVGCDGGHGSGAVLPRPVRPCRGPPHPVGEEPVDRDADQVDARPTDRRRAGGRGPASRRQGGIAGVRAARWLPLDGRRGSGHGRGRDRARRRGGRRRAIQVQSKVRALPARSRCRTPGRAASPPGSTGPAGGW